MCAFHLAWISRCLHRLTFKITRSKWKEVDLVNGGIFLAAIYFRDLKYDSIKESISCALVLYNARANLFFSFSYLWFRSIVLSKYLYVILKRFWLSKQFDCPCFADNMKEWGYITSEKCICKEDTSAKWLS